jgi:DNA topoisomerase-1
VIKSGRFGRFLACPGYPECTFTKPIIVEMPGKCPKCGKRILKRTSKNGYTYYGCEDYKGCGFMTWDVPVADNCPECGQTMFKLSGKGFRKPFCANDKCENFLPEDKRGFKKKKPDTAEEGKDSSAEKETQTSKTASETASKKATKTASKPTKKPAPKSTQKKEAKSTPEKQTTTKNTGKNTGYDRK